VRSGGLGTLLEEAMASLEGVALALGVSVPVARFLLCFVGSIPCSALARAMPAGRVRNLYAAATGLVLSYYSFGSEANLFFILPIVVGYGSMLLARPHCGAVTFFVAFGFLLTWYATLLLAFVVEVFI
jgi:lysophospholipid acyltransferase